MVDIVEEVTREVEDVVFRLVEILVISNNVDVVDRDNQVTIVVVVIVIVVHMDVDVEVEVVVNLIHDPKQVFVN